MKLCPICKRSWDDDFRVCPIDGLALQAGPAEADPLAGKALGSLRVSDKIADGELGPIYRGEDPSRGTVAVQYINQDRVASPVLMEAFEDAVKLAAKLIHPHVVRVHGLEHAADGTAAVIMEYVPGSSLSEYRAAHQVVDWNEACNLIKQAADGLSAAHRTSMLHGAVHPSRILVSADGTVKVGGFHRSGLRDSADAASKPADLPYWSPEQLGIIRDFPYPDYRADIYALGMTLYELLAGKLPYDVKTVEDLAAVMDAGPPLPPSFSNPQVSPTLSRVVLKAISKQPVDRHRSMEEFLRELDSASRPFREPERHEPEIPRQPQYPPMKDDSGLFAPPPPARGRESVENIWPEAAQAPHSGESSMFTWFKTRVGSGKGSASSKSRSAPADDSFFSSSSADDMDERTAIASASRKSRTRKRSFSETFTNFGRDDDLTNTDVLPRRRLSSRVYLLMGLGGLVLIGAVVGLIYFFGRAATGKLMIESTPPGAQIFLNDEYRGNTPLLIPEIKSDVYRLRLQLDGYEAVASTVEVGSDKDVQRAFVLNRLAPLQLAQQAVEPPPPLPAPVGSTAQPSPPAPAGGPKPPFESMFSNALRSRTLFPPSPGNAWDVLQSWQQREAAAPTAALEQARQNFCREVETIGLEKLDQRDFQSVRALLEQVRTRMPGQPCGGGLQARYDAALSRSVSDLRAFTNAAMNRGNFVTPDSDNALKYVRLILQIDPQDSEAKSLEGDLFNRGLEQAKSKADARQHQDALAIFTALKNGYSNPPGGVEPLNHGIEREKRRMTLAAALKVPYSVAVKHGHSFLRLKNRDCTGVLRADGFTIEFQTNGDHGFKLSYDLLKSVSYNKGKIVIEGSAVSDGKIELEQTDKNPSPSLADVYAKIEEYRKLRTEYLRQ
jgi:serine/threonine protein kinase